jgi:ketosteroid isomerase-like protein
MSDEERIRLVERGTEAFQRGDMRAVLELMAEDIELDSPPELGNSPRGARGRDAYLAWLEDWLEAWDDYTLEIEAIEAVGERHVVADCLQRATGKESGITVDLPLAYMYEIRDGQVTAMHLYRTHEAASEVALAREARDG